MSVTAVGEVPARRPLLRHRGRPGDLVVVSGRLGGAAAGLWALQHGVACSRELRARQLRPTPRVELGLRLARAGVVRSAADISDGLARDALHIAQAGYGVRLDPGFVPVDPGVLRVSRAARVMPMDWALSGGEDFELVMAIPKRGLAKARRIARRLDVTLTVVGAVKAGSGLELSGGPSSLPRTGFDHFAANRS